MRQRTGAAVTLAAFHPWTLTAAYTNDSRDGVRPWSGALGFARFDELPWPVQYDTHDTRIAAEWARHEGRVYASGAYRHSSFVNHVPTLTWDNPFRISDAPNPGVTNALVGPALARMALDPSNRYDEVSGMVVFSRLPLRSSLNAVASAGFMRQDEQLIPFSTNTAAVDILSSPVNPSFAATDPAGLPRQTARAAMDTRTLHARWTATPVRRLHLAAQYRRHDVLNDLEPFTFSMFVREDQDRRLPESTGGTYSTIPADYARQSVQIEGGVDMPRDSRLTASYSFERTDRDFREVDRMSDHKLSVAADTRHSGWLTVKASYAHVTRTTSPFDFAQYHILQGNPSARPMLPWLTKFDQSPFGRHEGQLMATAAVAQSVTMSGHVQIARTRFRASDLGTLSSTVNAVTAPADAATLFGLRGDRRTSFGIDVTFAPTDRFSAFADAGYERVRYDQGARQWSANGISDPYLRETTPASASNWSATTRDDYLSGGFGLDAALLPDRLRMNVQWTYARSDGRQAYDSPIGPTTADVNAFAPQPFEDVDDVTWRTFNPDVTLRLTRRLSLAAGYHRESWRVDDYTYKGFSFAPLYTNGVALLMGGLLPASYDVHAAYARLIIGF
jgi:hypothetical protein